MLSVESFRLLLLDRRRKGECEGDGDGADEEEEDERRVWRCLFSRFKVLGRRSDRRLRTLLGDRDDDQSRRRRFTDGDRDR